MAESTINFSWYIPAHAEINWDSDTKVNGMIKEIDAFLGSAFYVDQSDPNIENHRITGIKIGSIFNLNHFQEEKIAVATKTVFSLTPEYTMGNGSLQVFYNGNLLSLLDGDYEETDDNTVTFLKYTPEIDEIVSFRWTFNTFMFYEEKVVVGESPKTIFSVPSYTVGNHSLQVYYNGKLLSLLDNEYEETDANTVTVAIGIETDEIFVART